MVLLYQEKNFINNKKIKVRIYEILNFFIE